MEPLLETEDPVPILRTIMERFLKKSKEETPEQGFLFNGCPICNFAVEMSPLDEGFRSRLGAIYGGWRKAIQDALERGQKAGTVRADAIPEEEAAFIVASVAGTSSTGKVSQEIKLFQHCIRVVMRHLADLLPAK